MTKRTRLFVLIAAGVLVAGLGTGLVASYMGLPALSIITGNGPAELAYVPSTAHLVGFVDVRDVMNSELRQKFRAMHPETAPDGSIEEQMGINVENDIDQVVVAMLGGANGPPLLVARGRFDAVRIQGVIEGKNGKIEEYRGRRLFLLIEKEQAMALTFAEGDLAVLGPPAAVRAALDAKDSKTNVTDDAEMIKLVRGVEGGNAWAVGRFDALTGTRLPQNVLEQLPPINLFAVSGHINGGVRATVRAEARDDVAAQNLLEVVRGFVALARLQAGQNNEALTTLLNSVELSGDGHSVALSVTIPASALDLLTPGAGAAGRRAGAAF